MTTLIKSWRIILLLALLCGCAGRSTRTEQGEDPHGRYREQIAEAKRLLAQREDWADRAEWEVIESDDGWEIIAWRVEHPENKGASRYLPWGYSVIELDQRRVAVDYHRNG